jgi:hypothetical protein
LLTKRKQYSKRIDIDTQKKCVIISLEEIEQMFNQIERRIGVHERDVIVLEDRTRAFDRWWIQQQAQAPGIVKERTGGENDTV